MTSMFRVSRHRRPWPSGNALILIATAGMVGVLSNILNATFASAKQE